MWNGTHSSAHNDEQLCQFLQYLPLGALSHLTACAFILFWMTVFTPLILLLQTLNLRDVAMPMATLPMLAALTNVMDVTIDVSRMKYVALDELEAALCMLGLQAGSNLHWINVVVDDAYADELGFADDVRDYLEGLGKGHVCLAVVPLEDSVGYR